MKLQRQRARRDAVTWCADDEFFDRVVNACSSCRDVCQTDMQSMDFCIHNCPQYYREHVVRSTVVVDRRSVATARTTDHVPSLQYRLVSQPLFWTSVVSMFLALACTIAIVVLCLTSSRRRTCVVWSRGLRGSLSAAPVDADQQRLHHDDDDDYGRLSSTNISLIDEIDLRSTTSAADVNQTDTAGQRRQRTPVTAAGDKSSNTSRFVEKTRSWWKSGHHQPSGLPSRLHPPGCLPPTYIHTQPESLTETKRLTVSCSDQCPLMNEHRSDDETSQKLVSSDQRQRLSTVLTSGCSVQPLQCSGCEEERVGDVMTVCHMRTMRHNQPASSLGYCSRL